MKRKKRTNVEKVGEGRCLKDGSEKSGEKGRK